MLVYEEGTSDIWSLGPDPLIRCGASSYVQYRAEVLIGAPSSGVIVYSIV